MKSSSASGSQTHATQHSRICSALLQTCFANMPLWYYIQYITQYVDYYLWWHFLPKVCIYWLRSSFQIPRKHINQLFWASSSTHVVRAMLGDLQLSWDMSQRFCASCWSWDSELEWICGHAFALARCHVPSSQTFRDSKTRSSKWK